MLCNVLSGVYHKVVYIRWPPLLSMIFQRVFALQFFFCLLMILNDCRLSIHINQGLNIISLWSCNTNILYNEAEFCYSCTILAKSFNSPNKTKRCTKKTSVVLPLLIIRNGQSTIAIKSLQEKPSKPCMGLLYRTFRGKHYPSEKQLYVFLDVFSAVFSCFQWKIMIILFYIIYFSIVSRLIAIQWKLSYLDPTYPDFCLAKLQK